MAVRRKQEWSQEELDMGVVVLLDPVGFFLHFWRDDIVIPRSRTDLPESWRGKAVLTREQVLMATAVALRLVYGDEADKLMPGAPRRVCMLSARKTGKTSIWFERSYIWAATINTDQHREYLVTAPGEAHLAPVISRIDAMVDRTPLFRMLHRRRRADLGIDEWHTDVIFHRRIEGPEASGGRNMVGLRVHGILADEGGYANYKAYLEREQCLLPGGWTMWGGVPRPGEDSNNIFKMICRDVNNREWLRFVQGDWSKPERWDMRVNPSYHSDRAFAEQVGSDGWNSERVRTQVLGLDSKEGASSFGVIPTVDAPWFRCVHTNGEELSHPDGIDRLLAVLDFDSVADMADRWIVHLDYGYSPSPMVIGISFHDAQRDYWVLFARVVVMRASAPVTAKLINALDIALPARAAIIVMDAHGQGRGAYELLREGEEYRYYGYDHRLVSADFHVYIPDERVLVHKACKTAINAQEGVTGGGYYCYRCRAAVLPDDVAPRLVRAKQYLTELLAEFLHDGDAVLRGRERTSYAAIVLPVQDNEMVQELEGTRTVVRADTENVFYLPPGGKDADHNTDCLRCLARGIKTLHDLQTTDDAEALEELGFFSIEAGPDVSAGPFYYSAPSTPVLYI